MKDVNPAAVRLAIAGPRATITFDNPAKRNAFDGPMTADLRDAARAVAAERGVRVVVLEGAGGTFSAGGDFDAMTAAPDILTSVAAIDAVLDQAIAALAAIDVPVVAAIRGACMGGGVQLALMADLRIAADDARFAIPAVALGLVYPLDAIAKMVALAGPAATKRIFLAGATLDAAEALRLGLVDEVVAGGALGPRIDALAATIAAAPPETTALYKRLIDGLAAGEPPAAWEAARQAANRSPVLVEKLRAIKAKRGSR
ncbi:MAG: enoyl-CoA hydratase/isomerase family protein [Alphaproteobacteria bacterium]|nr:enoyl-CoA hydratase/isomerase family protein [Alphaproteobacteria bacterium]